VRAIRVNSSVSILNLAPAFRQAHSIELQIELPAAYSPSLVPNLYQANEELRFVRTDASVAWRNTDHVAVSKELSQKHFTLPSQLLTQTFTWLATTFCRAASPESNLMVLSGGQILPQPFLSLFN